MINRIKKLLNKIIQEEYYSSIVSNWKKENSLVDVYKNPSKFEAMKLTNGGRTPYRFIVSLEGDLYMWEGNSALHDEVSNQVKVSYRVKGAYHRCDYVSFFKVKTPEKIYNEIKDSKLMDILDNNYSDNLLRKVKIKA